MNTTTTERTPDRGLHKLLAAYAVVVLLLVLVSARLWWQSPLELIEHEFDYFLGLFSSPDPELSSTWIYLGRRLHLLAFVLLGALYLVIVGRLVRSPSAVETRHVVGCSVAVSLFFALGMPWVSPDVFFYIGTGWLDSHYGFSPYLVSALSVPAAAHDQMFNNIFPGFLGGTTGYGPLFQELAKGIAALSGGQEKLALALYKVAALGLHAGCSFLVWRLAPDGHKRVALFAYAANPLICFSVLTCAHNDHWMNLFVLLSLLAVSRRQWAWAGAALGAAFGIKYFPLVFVPVFGLAALVQPHEGTGRTRNVLDAARLVAGFVGVVALSYVFYPEALKTFTSVAGSGIAVYRNCIYYFLDMFTMWAGPSLLGLPPFMVSHEGVLGMFLKGLYIVVYAGMLWAQVGRLRRDPLRGIAEACLIATLLYFVLVNTGNQEWYLTWLMGLALVLPAERARRLACWLSAAFLPLVIYTVKNVALLAFIANNALYLLLVVLSGLFLASSIRALRTGGEA